MASIPAVGRSAMRWSCLQFNALLLPEPYRRLPAETGWKRLSPPPTRPGRNLENNTQSRLHLTHTAPMRFSGSSLILSCLTVSFSRGIVYSRVKRTPESEKKTYVYLMKRKIKNKMLVYVPGTYISPFVLCLLYTSPSPRDLSTSRMPSSA